MVVAAKLSKALRHDSQTDAGCESGRAVTAEALAQRAMQALRTGAAQDAVNLVAAAPASQRNTQLVQRTLAAAHAQNGDLSAAQIAIERALALPPVEPATRALAGRIALDCQQPARAFVQFEALVQIAPQQAGFWRYLWEAATTPATAGRALQLAESFKLDLSADVTLAWPITAAMIQTRRATDALVLAEQVLTRHPTSTAAHWLWVKHLTDQRPLTALHELQRLSATHPLVADSNFALDADTVDALLTVPEHYADDAAITAWRQRYAEGLSRLAAAMEAHSLGNDARAGLVRHTAFRLAYHGRDDLQLQCLRGDFLSALMRPVTPVATPRATQPETEPRLRVGFVSKHIRDCTVGHYFKRFFTDLSGNDISVHVYACGLRDAFTDAVTARVDHLHHFADDSNALTAMAQCIADDALDVLIYPEIGMEPLIEKLAAMRLAPMQCALWGHPVTTGLPTIDVFLSAAALEPQDRNIAQSHYRERLHLLPGLGTCYPKPPEPSLRDRAELGLPEVGTLVVCAQSPFKWSPAFTNAVAQILHQSPTTTLVVFDSPDIHRSHLFDDYLRHFFTAANIDHATRVVRLPQLSRVDFLAVLTAADVALDSFGFSGGNTSLDALAVGLPVVTLPGAFMRGRQTFAMLNTLQLPTEAADALIARDESQYVELAACLLCDASRREATRAAINARADRLFGDPAPVAALRLWLLNANVALN